MGGTKKMASGPENRLSCLPRSHFCDSRLMCLCLLQMAGFPGATAFAYLEGLYVHYLGPNDAALCIVGAKPASSIFTVPCLSLRNANPLTHSAMPCRSWTTASGSCQKCPVSALFATNCDPG